MGDEQTADTTESTLTTPVETPPVEPTLHNIEMTPGFVVEGSVIDQPLIQIDPRAGQYWDNDHQIWRDVNPAPEVQPDRTGQHWDVNSQQWLPDEVSL